MSSAASIDTATIQQWIVEKLSPETVEEKLVEQGYDAGMVSSHLKEFNRLRNAKRQFTGFVCLALGAFLGFLSCVLSILNPVPELYNIILFGLTAVAILIICLGLYFVFE